MTNSVKSFCILTLALFLLLTGCRKIEGDTITPSPEATETESVTTTDISTTAHDTTEPPVPLPCLIGFYDDLENNGNYTRLSTWSETWIAGKDIAVFDVIPSSEANLSGSSYKKLWTAEADKLPKEIKAAPYFVLKYTLSDGTKKEVEIKSYVDAEAITNEGYLEVYLYDDIHQEDGVWYYHLTAGTTDENTVISSFKLTAGKEISSVESISLTAFMDGSSEATINIFNG